MKKCNNCKSEFDNDSVKFCNNCGEKLFDLNDSINQQKCQKCGFDLIPSSYFCSNCGNKLDNNQKNNTQDYRQQNFQQNYQINNHYQKPIYTFPAFLSLILPGLGQIVKGEIKNGLVIFLLLFFYIISLFSSFSFLYLICLLATHIAQVYHAARKNPHDENDNMPGIILALTAASIMPASIFVGEFKFSNAVIGLSIFFYIIFLYFKEKENPGYINTTIIGKIFKGKW